MGNKNISIIGNGKLGLSFSLLCNSMGYNVHCNEVDKERVKQIENKTLKTSEPYIEQMLKSHTLKFYDSLIDVCKASDLIFIFVPTPSLNSGEYDHKYIEQVIDEIEKYHYFSKDNLFENKTIIISCTVMPGYCKALQERLFWTNIVYNPEFIAAGNIINGLKYADIVLIGGQDIPKDLFLLYSDIMYKEPDIRVLSTTGAEIAKIGINCFLSLKISYTNLLGEIIINSGEGENIDKILETVGSDSRIGNKCLKYGFGYGGQCIPRDMNALGIHANKVGLTNDFQKQIDKTNQEHLKFQKDYFIDKNPNKEVPFTFSYITFKKESEILTESQPLKLCLELLKEGYNISLDMENLTLPPELLPYSHQLIFGVVENGYRVN